MRSTRFSRAVNARQERTRIGVVTSVSSDLCMVLVGDGEVPAYLNDQVMAAVVIGAVVTLRRIGDTYEVASTRTGTTGGGGLILGPELIANGGFEYGTGASATSWSRFPWAGGEFSSARDTTPGQAVSGDARMLVTMGPGTDAPSVNIWTTTPVRVDSGVSYQGSAWVKADAIEASLVTTVRAITAPTADDATYFGAGSAMSDLAAVTAPGAAYQLLTGTLTVPTGHLYARIFLRTDASASMPAPVSTSWDLVSLRQRITS